MSSSEETNAPLETVSEDWKLVPWRKLEQHVYRLQKRIYRASERGNVAAVHRLQQLLMRSRSAQLLAVRRVTQDNQGKKTAGVDGKRALTPAERLQLVPQMHPKRVEQQKPLPVRRIWIPKPGKTEKRPLGIPTIKDRAIQALAKMALEPEWEAKFEPNSYGFRPGRGCHDAIGAIFVNVEYGAKYVLDADIAGCFDHISHKALLDKLGTYPGMRRLVKGWLSAGIMEGLEFSPTQEGTPQGGVISPLLANIALHGMEEAVKEAYTRDAWGGKQPCALVRYADDFVVFHPRRETVEKAKAVLEEWLKGIGLEMKPSKTRIVHTLEGDAGFNFLGFNVRQYPVGKTHTGYHVVGRKRTPLGFKTLIKPSKESVKQHVVELGRVVRKHHATTQEALIRELTPKIVGWANYYKTVVAKETFHDCDSVLYSMLRHWAKRRHPKKTVKWVSYRYWEIVPTQGWKFKTQEGMTLARHDATTIKRHIKVKGRASPYDGNLTYWSTRLRDHPLTDNKIGRLIKTQGGRCAYCGLTLRDGDMLEIDHIIPQRLGGDDRISNLQILHKHCHDQKTARYDARMAEAAAGGISENDHLVEEPDEAKVSCPVLK